MVTTRIIDLDAARQARAEANTEQPEVKFGGETYKLAVELPITVGTIWRSGKYAEALELIFVEPGAAERFMAQNPTNEDIAAIFDVYGKGTLGKSSASSSASKSSGSGTRRSSKRSTAST